MREMKLRTFMGIRDLGALAAKREQGKFFVSAGCAVGFIWVTWVVTGFLWRGWDWGHPTALYFAGILVPLCLVIHGAEVRRRAEQRIDDLCWTLDALPEWATNDGHSLFSEWRAATDPQLEVIREHGPGGKAAVDKMATLLESTDPVIEIRDLPWTYKPDIHPK